jgi:hypothetical protein
VSAEPARDPGEDRHDAHPGQGTGPDDTCGSAPGSAQAGVWGLEDADAGRDPDSSCPPEYVGVPLREVFAEADAREAEARAEAWAAGFLPRDVPPAARSAGAAGGFASGGPLDAAAPDLAVAAFAEEVSGPDGRCAGASDDELIGVLTAWQRQESRAASRKLAVVAELIRRRPAPGCEPRQPGGTPAAWGRFCGDELAAAAACSGQAAEKTLTLARDLATRLPGTFKALYDGAIDTYKAQIIADATRVLDAAGAAAAEALVLPGIAGKTPGQIRAAIARAVITIDPDAARARRERAQKDARVELWREDAGTAAVCGRDLPPADALAADQRITAYARELKAAGAEGTMDQLRARAFLDFTLGVSSFPPPASDHSPDAPRPASASGGQGPDGPAPAAPETGNAGPGHGSADCAGPGSTSQPGDGAAGPSAGPPGAPAGPPAPATPAGTPLAPPAGGPAARVNLTIPLATLLGLADRPGEAHELGAMDPALARTLAAAAAGNPGTTWCVTITDQDGHPTAHGCARPARTTGGTSGDGTRDGPAFAPQSGRSPPGPDGTGAWRLRTPGLAGRDLAVNIEPLAVTHCDHRHESSGYEPSDRLRHVVEVRDGECTYPPCRRQARNCDFEHAVPYDQGGRTCACNAGARCRHHHHAKQDPGWRLDQDLPGYHKWRTPSGRTYTTGPTTYPI